MRRFATTVAVIVLAGLAVTAIVIREVSLQGTLVELRNQGHAQGALLRDALSVQEELRGRQMALAFRVQSLEQGPGPKADKRFAEAENAGAKVDAPAPLPPSPEELASIEKARRLVDAAIASGRWTEQDRDELHQLLTQIPGPEGPEIMKRVVTATNAHKLDPQALGPPF